MQGRRTFILFVLLLTLRNVAPAQELVEYESTYYTIHTDLPEAGVREAMIRMTKVAEEYTARTSDFSGAIRRRMPFYLYKNPEDYWATGAPKTSAGYFNGDELVALAGDMGARTWHTVQHEAFHQFAHFVIRGDLPMWVNEGLAEYFGEGVFTGDGFVSGVIPHWRLKRIRENFSEQKFRPIAELMNLTREQWNSDIAVVNYDQAWSMVHFLAHGENGKYQKAMGAFIGQLGTGRQWQGAWDETFGSTVGFEHRWRDYWTGLPDNPTIELYAKANVATLTSFLGRAISQGQTFADYAAFKKTAENSSLKYHLQDWLPPALLREALSQSQTFATHGYSYTLAIARRGDRTPQQLVCATPNGSQIVGKFIVRNGRVTNVSTEIIPKK